MKKFTFRRGSNKVRLLTNPCQIKCHFHNRELIKVISDSESLIDSNICEVCIENNDYQNLLQSNYFVFGAKKLENDENVLLLMGGGQFRVLQDFARNPDYGDPRKFDIDFFMNVPPEPHQIKIIQDHEKIENFDELEKECLEYCKPYTMKDCITNKKDRQEFKKFFLKCKNYSSDLIGEILPIVETDFPQYSDMLKTLLIFS